MSRIVARLRYFVADAWDECRRSPWPNLLATGTLAAVLFVGGIALLVIRNVEARIARWQGDVRVEVYLRDGVAGDVLEALRSRARALEGVVRVEYVDKNEALRRYRRAFSDIADLPAELGSNPLPASLEISLVAGPGGKQRARAVASGMEGAEGVEDVRYDEAWLERLTGMIDTAERAALVLGLVVFGATVTIMAGVLRLAVYARRDEADIMLLVGASPGFVRGPYLVGGLAQGAAASLVALSAIEGLRRVLLARSGTGAAGLVEVAAGSPLDAAAAMALTGTGLVVGLASAWFAVRAAARTGA